MADLDARLAEAVRSAEAQRAKHQREDDEKGAVVDDASKMISSNRESRRLQLASIQRLEQGCATLQMQVKPDCSFSDHHLPLSLPAHAVQPSTQQANSTVRFTNYSNSILVGA